MKIELTESEVKAAVKLYLRHKLRIKGPVEVRSYGTWPNCYTVETNEKYFIYEESDESRKAKR